VKLQIDNRHYFCSRGRSVLTSRNNASVQMEDAVLFLADGDESKGGLLVNGRRYRSIHRWCAHTGETLISHEAVPAEFTLDALRQAGLVDETEEGREG